LLAAGNDVPILFYWSQARFCDLCTTILARSGPRATNQDRRDFGVLWMPGKRIGGWFSNKPSGLDKLAVMLHQLIGDTSPSRRRLRHDPAAIQAMMSGVI
jgi:hypothetical protein